MNKSLSIALTILSLLIIGTSCSNKDKVVLNVKVNSHNKNTLYLARIDFKQAVIIDSVKISKGDNSKKFRIEQGDEPTFYGISVKNGGTITILAEKEENITLTFDTQRMLDYKVTGSLGSEKVQALSVEFAKSKQKVDDLSKRYVATENEQEKDAIRKEFDSTIAEQKEFSLKFIKENHMSKANIMAIYQKYNDNLYLFGTAGDLITMKTVASAWLAQYPESEYTKGMVAEIKNIEQRLKNEQIKEMIASSEITIPELDIPNKDGVNVKLSSLKGKVVLLDFWITGNTGCLLDNRELMEVYSEFKGKGFEVYQVALDNNREEWINAVESANIPWISVCEGNPNGSYAAKIYNVSQIPANYLINRDQSIIGKNLYGQNLRKAIANALK